jgi:hypothetical protein
MFMYGLNFRTTQPVANKFQAEECLTDAWNLCHKDAVRNKE